MSPLRHAPACSEAFGQLRGKRVFGLNYRANISNVAIEASVHKHEKQEARFEQEKSCNIQSIGRMFKEFKSAYWPYLVPHGQL